MKHLLALLIAVVLTSCNLPTALVNNGQSLLTAQVTKNGIPWTVDSVKGMALPGFVPSGDGNGLLIFNCFGGADSVKALHYFGLAFYSNDGPELTISGRQDFRAIQFGGKRNLATAGCEIAYAGGLDTAVSGKIFVSSLNPVSLIFNISTRKQNVGNYNTNPADTVDVWIGTITSR